MSFLKKHWSNARPHSSLWLILVLDIVLTAVSFVVSYFLCSFLVPGLNTNMLLVQLPLIIAVTSVIFISIGSYRGFIKYDRVRDVYHIFNAICLTNILTIVIIVVNGKTVMIEDITVPLSIIIVHSILSFGALVVARFFYKSLYNQIKRSDAPQNKHHVLILGSGKHIIPTVFSLKTLNPNNKISIVGFTDLDRSFDDYDFKDTFPIYLKEEINATLIKNLGPAKIVVAKPFIQKEEITELLEKFGKHGIPMELVEYDLRDFENTNQLKVSSIRSLELLEDKASPETFAIDPVKHRIPRTDSNVLVHADAPDLAKGLLSQMTELDRTTTFILFGRNECYLSELVKELNGLGFKNTSVILSQEINQDLLDYLWEKHDPYKFFMASNKPIPAQEERTNNLAQKRSEYFLGLIHKYSV